MKFPRLGILRPTLALLLFGAATLAVRTAISAEPAGVEKKEPPKKILEPDAEEKFAEFLRRLKQAKQIPLGLKMKAEIGAVAKITGLDARQINELEAVAPQAAAIAADDWVAQMEVFFRNLASNKPREETAEFVAQILGRVPIYANQPMVLNISIISPVERAVWKEAIERVLSVDQRATWALEETRRQQELQQQVSAALKLMAKAAFEERKALFFSKIAQLKLTLNFSNQTGEKLGSLAKSLADEMTEVAGKSIEKQLIALGVDQWAFALSRYRIRFPDAQTDEANLGLWQAAVNKLLSPAELKLWDDFTRKQAEQRVALLSALTLALMDEKIALTAVQRQGLEPIVEELLRKQPTLYPDEEHGNGLSSDFLYEAVASAPKEPLEALLDKTQWARWQTLCGRNKSTSVPPGFTLKAQKTGALVEPVDIEEILSDFLVFKAESQRKLLVAKIMLEAEDAIRAAGLSSKAASKLNSAARGASEEFLEVWKLGMEKLVRDRIQEAPGERASEIIVRFDNEVYQPEQSTGIGNAAVWIKTVALELSEGERACWEKERGERACFRQKAISSFILAEFDRKTVLSAPQREKLEPLLKGLLTTWGAKIELTYPSEQPTWYLQSTMMFIPLLAMPEPDLRAILGKEQWELWAQSSEFSQTSAYFQNVQRVNQQLIEEAK